MKFVIALVAAAGVAVAVARPDEKDPKPANASIKASAETTAKFERLKSLAGVWQTGDEDKNGEPDTTVIYRTISGGSAVAEFLMPGTDHEMVTMYHLDGDSIVATHYCSLGNQPRMRSKAGGGSDAIAFDFVDGTNMLSANDMHIHSLVMTIHDSDRVTAAWKAYADGKPSEHSPNFTYTRVKDAEAAAKIATSALSCCAASCEEQCLLDGEGKDAKKAK